MEQKRSRAIRAGRRRRRQTDDTNFSAVGEGDHLLGEHACSRTHGGVGEEKKGDISKRLFDPRRDASSCCAHLSISNEGLWDERGRCVSAGFVSLALGSERAVERLPDDQTQLNALTPPPLPSF